MTTPWLILAALFISLGLIGAGLAILISQLRDQNRRRNAAKQHLHSLKKRTSRLLLACEPLLEGETPEETLLYQRFQAHGGETFDGIRRQVVEALDRSQEALADAFDLYRKLTRPGLRRPRSLAQQTYEWEMLYATLIGYKGAIHHLTKAELTKLLDPMLNFEHQPEEALLSSQLDDLRRELEGQPLKVNWKKIYAAEIDSEGILGYIAQVKTQIGRLAQMHQEKAQWWLQKAERTLHEAEKRVSSTKRDTSTQPAPQPAPQSTEESPLLSLEVRLEKARASWVEADYLQALEQSQAIVRDLSGVSDAPISSLRV